MGLFHYANHLGDIAGDIVGRVLGTKQANELTAANNAFQADYAKHQVQYRVKDALKAGINPLAALGISSGYQPMFQNSTTNNDAYGVLSSIGNLAGGIGKGISKLFMDQEKESRELSLENQRLENDYKRAQIDHLRNLNPGATGGSYSSGVKTDRNSGPQKTVPVEDWLEGEYPGTQALRTAGGTMYVPSKDAADALDIEFGIVNPYAWEYAIRDYGGRIGKYLPTQFILNPKKYMKLLRKIYLDLDSGKW